MEIKLWIGLAMSLYINQEEYKVVTRDSSRVKLKFVE